MKSLGGARRDHSSSRGDGRSTESGICSCIWARQTVEQRDSRRVARPPLCADKRVVGVVAAGLLDLPLPRLYAAKVVRPTRSRRWTSARAFRPNVRPIAHHCTGGRLGVGVCRGAGTNWAGAVLPQYYFISVAISRCVVNYQPMNTIKS